MQGEIRLVQETVDKIVITQSYSEYAGYEDYQMCLKQDGNVVMQGGNAICTSTTISYATTLLSKIGFQAEQ